MGWHKFRNANAVCSKTTGGIEIINIAVIYATRTKHSKKITEAIGSLLNVDAKNIAEKPALNDVDLLFVVGGIYGGVSNPELLGYIKKLEEPLPKSAALVTSCASGRQKQIAVRSILEENGIRVIDEFVCRGSILFISAFHPNANDLKGATHFAYKIVSMTT